MKKQAILVLKIFSQAAFKMKILTLLPDPKDKIIFISIGLAITLK